MSFTFLHPALELPLSYLPKNWISVTQLIKGLFFLKVIIFPIATSLTGGILLFIPIRQLPFYNEYKRIEDRNWYAWITLLLLIICIVRLTSDAFIVAFGITVVFAAVYLLALTATSLLTLYKVRMFHLDKQALMALMEQLLKNSNIRSSLN